MKEITFITRNKARWDQFEQQLKKPSNVIPDKLADQFIQLTDDLAYARTFFPNTHTTAYLNGLSQKTHLEIYRNKREKGRRIPVFFKTELPLILFSARPYFLIAFIVFMAAWLLGVVSSLADPTFVRSILGDSYVNMTLDNIEKGDPMAVYGQMSELPMSVLIIINNVRVAWQVFLYGFLTPLGAIYRLCINGIMLGSFQAFFYQKHLLGLSTTTIMIHGTLELSAIVLAGGAGIQLGRQLLFPGTYPRQTAFKHGAVKGVKIMIPITLIFFAAGLIEGFVTRHYSSISHGINGLIIGLSILLISWYFFIYPGFVHKKSKQHERN